MAFRRILLRIMLWSLAIGAAMGAAAVLLGGSMAIWRVCWTMLTAGAAAALLALASRLSDQKAGRTAGLVGMLLVILEFLLILAIIWDVFPGTVGGISLDESLGMTAVFLFLCSLPAVLFLRLYSEPIMRVAAVAGILLTIATFVLLAIGSWGSSSWSARELWLSSGGAVGGIGLVLASCLVGVGASRPRVVLPVLMAGAVAAAFAMFAALTAIWEDLHEDTGLFRIPFALAAVVAHANLCYLAPLQSGQRWVRLATIAAAACTAVFVNVSLSLKGGPNADFMQRLAGAGGVIAGCGSLGLVVLARLNRRMGDRPPVLSEIRELTLICPGCQKKQTLHVGEAVCPTCRLKFHLGVEEPRCPQCDYLVFLLQSDRCPECGCALNTGTTP